VKELLSYGLAVAGLVVMLTAFVTIAGRLKYYQMKPVLLQLLRTQPNRVEIMCRTGKGSCLEPLGAAMKAAAMMKSQDPTAVTSATKATYDAMIVQVNMLWKGRMKRAKTALGLGIGAVVLAISVDALPVVHILLLVGALVAGGLLLSYKLDVDRSLVLARAEILPEVERAFIDGRYVLPP
jgi:hypothetical protein